MSKRTVPKPRKPTPTKSHQPTTKTNTPQNIKPIQLKIWLLKAFVKPRCPLQSVHKKILKMHLRHWRCWLLGQACGWWRWRWLLGWTLDQSVADQLDQPKPRNRHTQSLQVSRPQPATCVQSNTAALPRESAPLHLQFPTCTSAAFSTSVRHLERIPFVPL